MGGPSLDGAGTSELPGPAGRGALAARAGQHVTLDWPLLGVFTGVAVLGSLVGGRVSSRINPDRLTIGFVVLLYAVAAYTGVRSGAQLL